MLFALRYAKENRRRMMEVMKATVAEFVPEVKFLRTIDIHHNYAACEEHFGRKVFVHRKGATSAKLDEIGIISGSMGTASYIVRGIVRTNSSDETNPMPNPALNYGYAIVRAAMARALVKAGLLCVCGIHHSNRSNVFALADDMMEPYRPFFDEIVFGLPDVIGKNWTRMNFDSRVKRELMNVVACDVSIGGLCYPLALALDRTAQSLADVVMENGNTILLPEFV